jgi:formylglycine-generating enzyme required for sulfatase activity
MPRATFERVAMTEEKKFALLGDTPVLESVRVDLLQFESYAKVLAGAAMESPDPITIGVFGHWGTGKTSLLRLMKKEVEDNDDAAAVWFNAWQYEKEEHLIVPLTATISKQLENPKWSDKLKEGAKRLRDALRSIAYGISIKGKVGIPMMSEAEVNLSPKDMIERYQDLTKDSVLARSLYFDAFERLEEFSKKGTPAPRVVVFVDDLDRCFPEKAVELLEGIKLVLNQPGFSFVIGVNEEIIQAFIEHKYTKDYPIDGSLMKDYLDKIVQVKIRVPEREPAEMSGYIQALVAESKVFEEKVIADVVPLIAEACNRNPRSIIRLLNRIIVTVRIGELEQKEYQPLALLIHLATDETQYVAFRNALDISLRVNEQSKTIGGLLADKLGEKDNAGRHSEFVAGLKSMKVEVLESEWKKVLAVLEANEHLCRLLKTEVGLTWLREKPFRDMTGQAGQRTQGEAKQAEVVQSADPIADLEANMVRIPGGAFKMGSGEIGNATPVHDVTLGEFCLLKTQVTQAQYQAVMGGNPSNFKGADRPVENVSWDEAKEFCKRLSERTKKSYILPSEAQWEYACRAGSDTNFCFGNEIGQLDEYAWYSNNSAGQSQPVGRKKPNAFGLYDMHGNVWEWVEDDWHDNYNGAPTDGSAWVDEQRAEARVGRGGSFVFVAGFCRSAFRSYVGPGGRVVRLGFRPARSIS